MLRGCQKVVCAVERLPIRVSRLARVALEQATLVITKDGTTKTCKLPLPRGIPSCS
ncbi:MAG: hypothetical protein ABI681_00840 [Gemmatimonadales bacterium]